MNYSVFTVTVYSIAHRTIVPNHAQCFMVKTMPTTYHCKSAWHLKSKKPGPEKKL